jgi:cell division protein FtsI/penicillin-binding protein 2
VSPAAAPPRRRPASPPPNRARRGGSERSSWYAGQPADFRARGIWLLLATLAMAITLGGHLVDLQVVQHARLAGLAAQEHQESFTLPAHRGRILDRGGRLLASDKPTYTVYVDPGLIDPGTRHDSAIAIAGVLGMPSAKVEQVLAQQTRYAYLARNVSDDQKARLDGLPVPGIIVSLEEQRVYEPSALPGDSFASTLLGYVNADGRGQYGVEGYYDSLLRGTAGSASVIRDNQGNPIVFGTEQRVDPKDGVDIQLGLDSQIQYWAEQALAKGVDYAQSESGEILIMDTKTGAIRAWAQYPSYDANAYAKSSIADYKDQAISGLYEPGSVMKVVTFAGGLENKAITPATQINEGPLRIGGYTIHDWDNRAHGTVSMQQVLDQSLNNGAIQVQQKEGEDAFYRNLLAFGIGAPTGVDLYGEANQELPPQNTWSPLDFAETSFGQHAVVTPVEMLAAINAVANGGVWVQPHAADAIVDPATGHATPVVPTTRRVVSAQTASTLASMMTGVVDNHDGSGFAARIAAFKGQVAGKTGTASEPTNGRYQGDIVTSFAGFLPASNPQFTMLVTINHPHTGRVEHEGAYLAAPVWHDLALVLIDQWRIVP